MTDEELERSLALDGSPGPALAIGAADASAIVEAALVGAGFEPGAGGGGGGGGAGGGGAGAAAISKMKLAILAGAALAVVVLALLAWRGTRGGRQRVAAVIADAAIDTGGSGSGTTATIAEPPVLPAEPAIEPATIEPPPERVAAPPAAPTAPKPPARAKPAAEREAADDLLAAANAKRAAKEWRASDALYARVVERAPKSLAAQTALVASASLRLEHLGDPKGAALRFRRALALAPRGALAEDARWGLAEAARALHDPAAEKAALDDFVAHHADSPLATRAKARRAELP